ncbi:MAG: hypothetical protein HONBIEJF_00841 [Fimbriimonadaceae bacterium]|nr:hypothetical protein [Fimbriimonadaceae bacterium]
MNYVVNTSKIARVLLGIVCASIVMSEAEAGWVKAESKVWYKSIRRSHNFKKAPDYGDSGYAPASYSSTWANAREWWEYSGGQYNRRNWTATYVQGSKYAAQASAWWSSFLAPDEDVETGPGFSGENIAFEPGTSTNFEVQYFETPVGLLIQMNPETFAKVDFTTVRPGERAMSELRFIVDGQVSTAQLSVASDNAGNLLFDQRITGVFKELGPMVDFDGTGQVILRFAAREFYVHGTLKSTTIIDSMSNCDNKRALLDGNDGRPR